jgi:competence protein ComEA
MWKWLEQYFTFSKGERNGIVGIVVVTLVIIAGMYAYDYLAPKKEPKSRAAEIEAFLKEYNEKNAGKAGRDSASVGQVTQQPARVSNATGGLFEFDPNSIGQDEWVKLGFSEKQAASIEKYKAKGGRFYKTEDLKRLYVISPEQYARIAPFVKISGKVVPADLPKVNINTADSVTLESLMGIGPVLAHKIISYRAKLGGYVKVEQLRDIQTLPAETYNNIKPQLVIGSPRIARININTAEVDELKAHPYIHAPLAKAIVKYRERNGGFKSLDELRYVNGINDSIYKRVVPYLKVN